MPSEQEIIDRMESRIPLPDATLRTDEKFMEWRRLVQAERRIAELLEDVKQGIFPGWQSYDEWVKNGRSMKGHADE